MDETVLKFGGSSLATAHYTSLALGIIERHHQRGDNLAVVVSAVGVPPGSGKRKATDLLLKASRLLQQGRYGVGKRNEDAGAWVIFDRIRAKYAGMGRAIGVPEDVFNPVFSPLEELCSDWGMESFRSKLIAVMTGQAGMSQQEAEALFPYALDDYVAGAGELGSIELIAGGLRARGIAALAVDASKAGFVTDLNFTRATLTKGSLENLIAREFMSRRSRNPGAVLVYSGFIASDRYGNRTTLGRDGSNVTALALGSAIKANEIVIYSDEPILPVDPRILPGTQPIRQLCYPEVEALARGGVNAFPAAMLQVLRERQRLPPIYMRSTSRSFAHPDDLGTLITPNPSGGAGIKGMAVLDNISFRVFPVSDSRQAEAVLGIIQSYKGASVLRYSYVKDHNGQRVEILIRTDPAVEERLRKDAGFRREELQRLSGVDPKLGDDPSRYFRKTMFYHVLREALGGRAPETLQLHDAFLLTLVGYNLGTSDAALAQIWDALARIQPQQKLHHVMHRLPIHREQHAVQLVVPRGLEQVARELYKGLKRINVVLLGPGNVGQRFLEKVLEGYEEERLTVVGVVDSSGYATKPGGLTKKELAAVIAHKRGGRSFDGSAISGVPTTPSEQGLRFAQSSSWYENEMFVRSLESIAGNETGDFVVVDATNSEPALYALTFALQRGMRVASANKKPYAIGMEGGSLSSMRLSARLSELYRAVLEGKVLNRATVGANLGAPDALLGILAGNPEALHISMCASGSLGYICSQMDKGMAFSEAVMGAIKERYMEPSPYDDLSGQDVLNKAVILARMIAAHAGIDFAGRRMISHEPFLEKGLLRYRTNTGQEMNLEVLKAAKGDEFVKLVSPLDSLFAELMAEAGEERVLRYVADIRYDRNGKTIEVVVGLKPVHRESLLGSLDRNDNAFLFGVNGRRPVPLFPPGSGAGIEETATALYNGVLTHAAAFRA